MIFFISASRIQYCTVCKEERTDTKFHYPVESQSNRSGSRMTISFRLDIQFMRQV
jgi:hypothetical protein